MIEPAVDESEPHSPTTKVPLKSYPVQGINLGSKRLVP